MTDSCCQGAADQHSVGDSTEQDESAAVRIRSRVNITTA